ncbi:hypothetical protein CT0861_13238, partial [Colletotrichum tofieldiae]
LGRLFASQLCICSKHAPTTHTGLLLWSSRSFLRFSTGRRHLGQTSSATLRTCVPPALDHSHSAAAFRSTAQQPFYSALHLDSTSISSV